MVYPLPLDLLDQATDLTDLSNPAKAIYCSYNKGPFIYLLN